MAKKPRLGRAERVIVRDYHTRIRSSKEAAIRENLNQPKPKQPMDTRLGFRSVSDKLGSLSPRFRDPWNTRRPARPGSDRIKDGSFACVIVK